MRHLIERTRAKDFSHHLAQYQIVMVAASSTHGIDRPNQDGRRGVSIEYELLSRVDGSARFGFGAPLKHSRASRLTDGSSSIDDVHAMASVSGPIEVRLVAENSTKATFEVTVRPLASIPGTDSKALGAAIKSLLAPSLLLTRHPRTLVQLVVQPLSPSLVDSPKGIPSLHPGIAAASINASSLALMNAAVPMKGVVCAVAVARASSEKLVLNPTGDQLASSTASGCFAFIFTAVESPDNRLHASEVWSNWQSSLGFDVAEMFAARDLAQQGARHVWELMKESVRPSVGVHRPDVEAEVTDRPPEAGDDGDKMEI